MKTLTLFSMAVLAFGTISAQNFTDNFESYIVGSYLGPQSAEWTTFSGFGQGSSEDVKVTNLVASSGTKSITFASTELGGGPQDVILDFQNTHTSGIFTFESKFYVLPGKKASFSFQKDAILGNGYAIEVFMSNGNMLIQNQGSNLLTVAYPESVWFALTIKCNLSTKVWEIKIDGISAGKWINPTNSVSYLEIYPVETSQFLMDDVSYSHVPYTITNLNASSANLVLDGFIVSQIVTPKFTILNTGSTPITSFDATINYNGQNFTENVNSINLAPLSSSVVTFPSLTLVAGINNAEAKVFNVNGTNDDDSTDNKTNRIVNPVIPATGKIVVGEEGTGTWCEWCPRGTVAMADFESKYDPYWAGIAVHRSDPMQTSVYNTGMAFIGFPSAKVNRKGVEIDPNQMTLPFLSELQIAPKAIIEVGATYNIGTGELNVSGEFNFQSAATNGYKAAFVLTEDGVTGTTSGYAQSNAYSGGGNGVMGGYELLSNPVPASQMMYNHVARIIAPSFEGYAQSFPTVIASGSTHIVNHKFTIPSGWNSNNLHLIVLLIASNGQIDNAGKATLAEAVANGFILGTSTTASVTELNEIDATFKIFPNPASTLVNLSFNLIKTSNVHIRISDVSGKDISNRNYENMKGASTIQLDSSELAQGIYTIEVTINHEKLTRKLVIQ